MKLFTFAASLSTASAAVATIDSWQYKGWMTATTASTDCSTLPQSMNGSIMPYGCPGAVWSNNNPAKRYCNGDHKVNGDQKFQWWSRCCRWEDNKCVPKKIYTQTTDCSKPPKSMNGGSKPVGCGGAVWMNDKPARKYCNGDHKTPGDQKFQWWAACCTWKDNSCVLKTTTQTEESNSVDTRAERQIDPSIKNHAHPTMPNAPTHANALNQARGGLAPHITAKFASLRAGSASYAPSRTCTALTCSHDTHHIGVGGYDAAKQWTSVRVTHACKVHGARTTSAAKKVHGCRETHCQLGHYCALEVNGDCSCIESNPYDRIANCVAQDGPKCNACDAGHILHQNACKIHGEWSAWGGWSTCSKSCGGGDTVRTRACSSPAPKNGGNNCVGADAEDKACNEDLCYDPSKQKFTYYHRRECRPAGRQTNMNTCLCE